MLLGRPLLRERPGQHEFGFEHRATRLDQSIEGRRHPLNDGMPDPFLNAADCVASVALIPASIEVLRYGAELDDEVVGEILRLDLPALLPPQMQQSAMVVAHNDPGVRATDKQA